MEYVFEGPANRGQGRRPHRVITTVTDLTKVIDGVRTVVIWERDINAGRLLEGESPSRPRTTTATCGTSASTPRSTTAGGSTARRTRGSPASPAPGGIMIRAAPRAGQSSYRQGFAPTIEFADRAKVVRAGPAPVRPGPLLHNVLVTDETNPNEPADGHQRKFYAPGIGPIRAAPVGGREHEVLGLTRVSRLDPAALEAVRRRALGVDRRAYAVSRRVYAGRRWRSPAAGRAVGRARPRSRSAHRPDLADQAAVCARNRASYPGVRRTRPA